MMLVNLVFALYVRVLLKYLTISNVKNNMASIMSLFIHYVGTVSSLIVRTYLIYYWEVYDFLSVCKSASDYSF